MSTLPEYLTHMAFDPKGTNPDNLVDKESHFISSEDASHQIVVPLFGPFFDATLYDAQGKEIDKTEYRFGERLPELKGDYVEKDLYVSILLTKPRLGEVFVSYQSVGAELTQLSHLFLSYLVSKMNEPRSTHFDRVLKKPHRLPAYEHRHHWVDFVNKTALATSIDELKAGVNLNHTDDKVSEFSKLQQRVTDATKRLNDLSIGTHIGDPNVLANPHSTTADDIDAERVDTPARNADQFYTMTFYDFVRELHDTGLNRTSIANYIRKWNRHDFEGNVVAGVLNWGRNPVGAKLQATNLFRIGSDGALVEVGPDGAKLRLNGKDIYFNGYELFDREKAIAYSDQIDGKLIVAVESDDFVVSGDTTEINPLRLSIKYTLATESTKGFARIVDEAGEETDGYVISSMGAKAIDDRVQDYLLKTVTVNGRPISADIVVPNSELGLGSVDNTADLDKELSAAERQKLSTIVQDVHNHNWNEIDFVAASKTHYGIGELALTVNDNGAVSSKLAADYVDEIIELGELFGTKALVSNFYFEGVRDVELSSDGSLITIHTGKLLKSVDGVVTESDLMGGNVQFPVEEAGKDKRYLIYFVDDGEGRRYIITDTQYPIKEYAVLVAVVENEAVFARTKQDPIADFGSETSLVDHKEEATPHGLDKPIEGLTVVENADVFIQSDGFTSFIWDGNFYNQLNLASFAYAEGTGHLIQSAGANPMGWKTFNGKGLVYQSSFVVKSEDNSDALDVSRAPHSVVFGLHNSDRFRILSCVVEADEKPRFYVERWDLRLVDNKFEIYLGSYTQINVVWDTAINVPTSLDEGNHYRFYYDETTNEIRIELTGKQHLFYKGTVVGVTNEVQKELDTLLNNPCVGVRGSTKVPMAVGPSIRKPYNEQYVCNNYRSLFRTYVSAGVLDRVRGKNVSQQVDLTLTGSYVLADDVIELGNISSKLPTGFTNLEVDILRVTRDVGPFDREIDHEVLSGDLYYGAELGLNKWDKGYGLSVRRNDNIRLPLTVQKTYNGTVVSSLINDGDSFSIRVRVKAYNVLWGITSDDWQYLCHILA